MAGRKNRVEKAHAERAEAQRGEEAQRFLARASQLLASSLDYDTTLTTVAKLALLGLGSWSITDLVEEDGSIRRLAIVHRDPEKQRLAEELKRSWPPQTEDPIGAPVVMRTRRSEVVPHVTDEMLVEAAHNPENLEVLRKLGIRSFLVVPLIARQQVLGAITFVAATEGRQYTEEDLALAEDLAARGALAADNARLFRDAKAARREAERNAAKAEEAKEEAKAASKAKSEFLAVMSHELRTPLAAIIGFSDILGAEISGALTEEQQEQIERIRTSAGHLMQLIDQALTFSRIEAGREAVEAMWLDLAQLARESAELVRPLALKKGLRLEVHAPEEEMPARTDSAKVRQILLNLLSNAVKFTKDGEVELSLREEDDRMLLQVRDTGIGISSEEQEKIFEPFRQVGRGRTRHKGGTGIGLSVTRQLSEMLGGSVAVESTLGAGSTFTVELAREYSPPVT